MCDLRYNFQRRARHLKTDNIPDLAAAALLSRSCLSGPDLETNVKESIALSASEKMK